MLKYVRNAVLGAVAFVVAAGVVSGTAGAFDGCASGYTRLAHLEASGTGFPVSCGIAACVPINKHSRAYFYTGFSEILIYDYRALNGTFGGFGPCPASVSNGPWVN